MKSFTVRAPATTANLGPAFDCLGLALDLWNETHFEFDSDIFSISVSGEGQDTLPLNQDNLIIQSMHYLFRKANRILPKTLSLTCQNQIPLSSGLGSSSSAVITGLLAANHLLDTPYSKIELLQFAAAIEGHADNTAAALYGGLVLLTEDRRNFRALPVSIKRQNCLIVLPQIDLSTQAARSILPKAIPLPSAVFNIGHAMWLLEALKVGDLDMLSFAMQDQLHQAPRLAQLPGAEAALQAANRAGVAAAISGAGPALIAFIHPAREKEISDLLSAPFNERSISTRVFMLNSSQKGATVN